MTNRIENSIGMRRAFHASDEKVSELLKDVGVIEAGTYVYPIRSQEKGLREDESDELMTKAYLDGYGYYVDQLVFRFALKEFSRLGQLTPQPMVVLEFGGGEGELFDELVRSCRFYINAEPSELERSASFLKRIKDQRYVHLRCSAEELPLKDGVVDVVIALASLDHIPRLRDALDEAKRVLRPGGTFLFSLNNRGSWWKRVLANSKMLKQREALILKDHYILWNASEAREVMSRYFGGRCWTVCFLPQIPHVWKFGMPFANFLGPFVCPNWGGNIVGVYRKV